MLDWLDWILDNERQILELVQAESGKSAGDTTVETMGAVEVINYYAKNARRFLADLAAKLRDVPEGGQIDFGIVE